MKFDKFRDKFNKCFLIFMILVVYIMVLVMTICGVALVINYWGKDMPGTIMGIFTFVIGFVMSIAGLINCNVIFDLWDD